MFQYPALHVQLRNALLSDSPLTRTETENDIPDVHPIGDIFVTSIISACESLGHFHDQTGSFYISKAKRSAYERWSDRYEENGPGFLIGECACKVDAWYGTSIAEDQGFFAMINRLKAILYKWRYEIEYDY